VYCAKCKLETQIEQLGRGLVQVKKAYETMEYAEQKMQAFGEHHRDNYAFVGGAEVVQGNELEQHFNPYLNEIKQIIETLDLRKKKYYAEASYLQHIH
jgi:hypothetical protein